MLNVIELVSSLSGKTIQVLVIEKKEKCSGRIFEELPTTKFLYIFRPHHRI